MPEDKTKQITNFSGQQKLINDVWEDFDRLFGSLGSADISDFSVRKLCLAAANPTRSAQTCYYVSFPGTSQTFQELLRKVKNYESFEQ
jgi:hypothetical protein